MKGNLVSAIKMHNSVNDTQIAVSVSVGHVTVVSQRGSLSQVLPLCVEGWFINRSIVTTGGAGAGIDHFGQGPPEEAQTTQQSSNTD